MITETSPQTSEALCIDTALRRMKKCISSLYIFSVSSPNPKIFTLYIHPVNIKDLLCAKHCEEFFFFFFPL